jgi:hypothetical protein
MAREKTGFTDHEPREIIHDIKNCMGVVLLTIERLELDTGNMSADTRAKETLEKIFHKMNGLIEQLTKLLGKQTPPKKRSASRTRGGRREKLPRAVIIR